MGTQQEANSLLRHTSCKACGSSDGNALYSDGHSFCFVCSAYSSKTVGDNPDKKVKNNGIPLEGEIKALKSRGIDEETARKWQYRVGLHKGKKAHFAYYFSEERVPIACKIRFEDKSFSFIGDTKNLSLYGKWLWRDGGRMLVITEGEIDALSVSQLQGNKWPVVSVPNGANGAVRAVKKDLEWVSSFDKVIFLFDMDQPGREAAKSCAALLPPGKAFIGSLSMKDANELLVACRGADVIDAIWGAKKYRPDGIVEGSDITLDMIKEASPQGLSLPYKDLDDKLGGIRKRELTILTAGSGIGKSTLAREIAYHLHQKHGCSIGNIYLEESLAKTAQGYVAIHNNIPLGVLRAHPSIISDEKWKSSLSEVIDSRMFFYDHFGSLCSDNLIGHLRYMAVSLCVDFIILDHISIVVSGLDNEHGGERKAIDIFMTRLRSLVEETGVGIIAIVHLRQPEGTPHEEGGRVTLSQLRGSGSLKQLSDNVIAMERNQQHSKDSDVSSVRVLKNREFGDVGPAGSLRYDRDVGRLVPYYDFEEQEEEDIKDEGKSFF